MAVFAGPLARDVGLDAVAGLRATSSPSAIRVRPGAGRGDGPSAKNQDGRFGSRRPAKAITRSARPGVQGARRGYSAGRPESSSRTVAKASGAGGRLAPTGVRDTRPRGRAQTGRVGNVGAAAIRPSPGGAAGVGGTLAASFMGGVAEAIGRAAPIWAVKPVGIRAVSI